MGSLSLTASSTGGWKKDKSRMDSLSGVQLIKADGSSHAAEAVLEGKDLVLYYFSAHWCPPCRHLTPILKDFYQEVEGIEIVFVSSDQSADDMASYMKEAHGDWFAVEHNSAVADNLSQKYGVSGIPCLVVCKKDGTWSPRRVVRGSLAWPLPRRLLHGRSRNLPEPGQPGQPGQQLKTMRVDH